MPETALARPSVVPHSRGATMLDPYDAVVLAGGRARRMHGADKPETRVHGRRMLDTVLAAVSDAQALVVVGPERTAPARVTWVREDPPGGGPVAALGAALQAVAAPVVAVLAADLPFLLPTSLELLRRHLQRDGVVLVDDGGRDQLLVGVWRTTALRDALTPFDPRLGAVLSRLQYDRLVVDGHPWFDCDTEEDIAVAERRPDPGVPSDVVR